MDQSYLSSSIIQTVISLFVGVLTVFVTFLLFRKVFTRKYEIEIDNIAFSILLGSIIISVSYLMSGLSKPIANVLRVLSSDLAQDEFVWNAFQYSSAFISIGLVTSLLINVIGLIMFVKLTRGINEFKEISEDNVAVGIITGCIILGLSFFVREGLIQIIEAMIPYPDFGVDVSKATF